MGDFFDISGDTIKAAEAAANFKMVVPDNAKKGKKGDSWTEHGTIKAAFAEATEANIAGQKCPILILQADVAVDNLGSNKNSGYFPCRFKARMNPSSMTSNADKGSPMGKQAIMTRISIARLKSLLTAMGVETDREDGGYSQGLLALYFPPINSFSGEPSPLVGQQIWFEVTQGESESATGGKFTNIEVSRVLPGEE